MSPAERRAAPVQRVRDERPDALERSRHARLHDLLLEPLEDRDPERAAALCADICRRTLRDFSPVLLLLPIAERHRLQAVVAYGATLFDFARQAGPEGDRLSQINRWEFELESALEGTPTGQPIFVRLAELGGTWSFPRSAFDDLHAAARRRVTTARPRTAEEALRDARTLAVAGLRAVTGTEVSEELARLAGAVLRARFLQNLGEDMRRHQERLPGDELPDAWSRTDPGERQLARAVELETERLLAELADRRALADLAVAHRPAARFAVMAAGRLARQARRAGTELPRRPPGLGLGRRVCLLLGARLGWPPSR